MMNPMIEAMIAGATHSSIPSLVKTIDKKMPNIKRLLPMNIKKDLFERRRLVGVDGISVGAAGVGVREPQWSLRRKDSATDTSLAG